MCTLTSILPPPHHCCTAHPLTVLVLPAPSHVLPCLYRSLLQLYIDIEITDRHNTFYEKFSTRFQVRNWLGFAVEVGLAVRVISALNNAFGLGLIGLVWVVVRQVAEPMLIGLPEGQHPLPGGRAG